MRLKLRLRALPAVAAAALVLSRGRFALAQSVDSAATQNVGLRAFSALETGQRLTPTQIDAIARDLLSKLALEEKIGLMSGDSPFYDGFLKLVSGGYNRPPSLTAGATPRFGILIPPT